MAEAQEMKYCSNCKREIAAANFIMHEVHCRRNIVLCQKCQEPYPRSELEEHIEEVHAKVPCEKCQQMLEKGDLEDHMENDCPKRLVKCVYCEIDITRDNVEEHHDYCGTRTEQCFRCQRFIMIKDQQRHEESNCTYPEVKQESQTNGPTRPGPPGRLNSFAIKELSRMNDLPLDLIRNDFESLSLDSDEGSSRPPQRPSRPFVPRTSQSSISSASSSSSNKGPPKVTNKGPSRISKNTNSMNRRQAGRNAAEASYASGAPRNRPSLSQRNSTDESVPSNRRTGPSATARTNDNINENMASSSDIDRLMSVPGDFMSDEDLAQYIGQFGDLLDDGEDAEVAAVSHNILPDSGASPGVQVNKNRLVSEGTMLPCEFCQELYSPDELVLHESGCDPAVSVNSIPNNQTPTYHDVDFDLSTPSSRAEPTVVDNLGYMAAHDWISRPVPREFTSEDETMLPCEFCDEPFPLEFLVQHQAVCDANQTHTPRMCSPDIPRKHNNQNREPSPVLSRARRHQPDPEFIFQDESDEIVDPDRNIFQSRNTNTGQLTRPSLVKNSYSHSESTNRQIPNSRKNDSFVRRTSDSNTRAKRTLDDLVNNPIPFTPTNVSSTTTWAENRRERSTAFSGQKNSTASSVPSRTMTNSRTSFTRNHLQNADTNGYQASFAPPKTGATTTKRGPSRPVPKNDVGSNTSSLNGMRVAGRNPPGYRKTNPTQTKKNDTSRR